MAYKHKKKQRNAHGRWRHKERDTQKCTEANFQPQTEKNNPHVQYVQMKEFHTDVDAHLKTILRIKV